MSRNKLTAMLSAIAGLVALWLGISVPKPGNPTPTPTPSASPSPSPSPLPTAFPTPSPAATPTPTPLPLPTNIPECALLATDGNGKCEDNPGGVGVYEFAVRSAQEKVNENRAFVDANGVVVNEGAYTEEVARLLRKVGYCATNGLLDEVWVKKDTNTFSEHYDLVTGEGNVWRKFAAVCRPARF